MGNSARLLQGNSWGSSCVNVTATLSKMVLRHSLTTYAYIWIENEDCFVPLEKIIHRPMPASSNPGISIQKVMYRFHFNGANAVPFRCYEHAMHMRSFRPSSKKRHAKFDQTSLSEETFRPALPIPWNLDPFHPILPPPLLDIRRSFHHRRG